MIHRHWLIAFVLTGFLAACGGNDDDAPPPLPGEADTGDEPAAQASTRSPRYDLPATAVWAVVFEADEGPVAFRLARISRFDPDLTERQARIENDADPSDFQTFPNPAALTTCSGALYAWSYGYNSIERIDLSTLEITGRGVREGLERPICINDQVLLAHVHNAEEQGLVRLSLDLGQIGLLAPSGPQPIGRLLHAGEAVWARMVGIGVERYTGDAFESLALKADDTNWVPLDLVRVGDDTWAPARGGQFGPAAGNVALLRVDADAGEVLGITELGAGEGLPFTFDGARFAGGTDGLWAAHEDGRTVARLDPASGDVLCRVDLPGNAAALSVGPLGVYAGSSEPGGLYRLNPGDCSIERSLELDGPVTAIAQSGNT